MIGKVVGNYQITEKIGEGGMGAVYRGIDVMLEREVAVKVLRPELASQPQVVERFRAEAVTLAKLNHPNIATLYSFLREGDEYFMVMEFVRGKTLAEIIQKNGPFEWNRAIVLFARALEGIDHAHRMGIIHRDIKPANIMLTDDGSIKVMDFGIARALGTARMTRHGSVVGTLEYTSPEQVRGMETDARSDIYSLGVLLYEMLTGRVPFASTNEYELMRAQIETAPPPPRTFAPQIPLLVEQAIMRALAKKREARYQTAGEFRAVLLGTLGAATNPLEGAKATYAAPATRALDAATTAAPASEQATQVISSPHSFTQPGPSNVTPVPAAQTATDDRSTRVDTSSGELAIAAGAATQVQSPQKTSAIRKLNRNHYAAAIIAVIVIAAAAIAWMSMRSTAQPASDQTEQSTPAEEEQNALPAPTAEEAQPAVSSDDQSSQNEAAASSDNTNTARPAVSRSNQNKNAAEPTAEATTTQRPETAPAPVEVAPQPQPPPTPPAQQTATANTNAAAKTDKKKGGGIGGVFRKIFGGGNKENKNDKKP